MNITKKQITYGIVSILAVIILAAAGTLTLRLINKSNENAAQQSSTSTPNKEATISDEEAKNLLSEADKARASGNYDAAKASYQKAQEHYKETKNTEKVAELDATLSLIEVEKKNAAATVKPKLVGEK